MSMMGHQLIGIQFEYSIMKLISVVLCAVWSGLLYQVPLYMMHPTEKYGIYIHTPFVVISFGIIVLIFT